jgi:hypothetical protein
MAELARARVKVGVEVGDRFAARSVADLVEADVGVPGAGVVHELLVEAEDLAGELEHAVDDPLEREVLADEVLVQPVLVRRRDLVVVAPVP